MTTDDITIIESHFVMQFLCGTVRFELWESDDLRSPPSLYAFDSDRRRHPGPPGQARAMKARIDAFLDIPTNPNQENTNG